MTFERFFLEEAWFLGVRVGFGGREGALASALIRRLQKAPGAPKTYKGRKKPIRKTKKVATFFDGFL